MRTAPQWIRTKARRYRCVRGLWWVAGLLCAAGVFGCISFSSLPPEMLWIACAVWLAGNAVFGMARPGRTCEALRGRRSGSRCRDCPVRSVFRSARRYPGRSRPAGHRAPANPSNQKCPKLDSGRAASYPQGTSFVVRRRAAFPLVVFHGAPGAPTSGTALWLTALLPLGMHLLGLFGNDRNRRREILDEAIGRYEFDPVADDSALTEAGVRIGATAHGLGTGAY